ncbi:MAG: methionyl-tRNA formyltransferase [Treponemataceae bacterium]
MLRVLYAGTPDVSTQPLIDLALSNKVQIVGVLTNPPTPQGRSSKLIESPVHQAVCALNATRESSNQIEVFSPAKLDQAVRDKISFLQPDILVCFAYGKIFRPVFLDLFPLGGINLHPSLLPKYRGPAPIPSVILNQEKETGITVQRLFNEMDSGDILLQTRFSLIGRETSESLLSDVKAQGGALLLDVLLQIEAGVQNDTPQNHEEATFCSMLSKNDGKIDWEKSAYHIDAQIRALYPWPKAFTHVQGKTLFLLNSEVVDIGISTTQKIGTIIGSNEKGLLFQAGDGVVAVSTLQWQAKKMLAWKDFLNGNKDLINSICE